MCYTNFTWKIIHSFNLTNTFYDLFCLISHITCQTVPNPDVLSGFWMIWTFLVWYTGPFAFQSKKSGPNFQSHPKPGLFDHISDAIQNLSHWTKDICLPFGYQTAWYPLNKLHHMPLDLPQIQERPSQFFSGLTVYFGPFIFTW